MYIPTTQYWLESNKLRKTLIILSVGLLAAYPIYKSYYYGYGVQQFQRHLDLMAGKSMFYNPWQYRILSPYLAEVLYQFFQSTIESWFALEAKVRSMLPAESKYAHSQVLLDLLKSEGFITYNAIFIFIRLTQHLIIFYLMFIYFKLFVKNEWLIWGGIVLSSFLMGNAFNDSDLSLNTYTDIILYLLAAYVMVSKKRDWLIPIITILGAFNRETSLLIPVMYMVYQFNWSRFEFKRLFNPEFLPSLRSVGITAISLLCFAGIFVMLRWYYGYVPQTYWRAASGWQMLRLNLFSAVSLKTYFELFGAMSILPLLFIYDIKRRSYTLLLFFVCLVPLWFGVHFWSVVAYQSRLFLVPTLVIFLPGFLEMVEQYPQSRVKTVQN